MRIGAPMAPSAVGEEVVLPAATRCCALASDRGLLHPELPPAALSGVAAELAGRP